MPYIDRCWTIGDLAFAMDHPTARHPIAVVAERTGLSQDVIRVWERRYRAVEPGRGPKGHRAYSDADVTRLRLLHAATAAGRSIGQVARLSTDALARLVDEDVAARSERAASRSVVGAPEIDRESAKAIVDDATALTSALDGVALDQLLRRAITRLGITAFIERVATPLLRHLGDEWHAGRSTIAHEHLASSIIHDLLVQAMRSLARVTGGPVAVVATPSGERHAIGAALIGAAAASEGWRIVYLGADLPASEIAAAAVATKASVVALSVIYVRDRAGTIGELRALRSLVPAPVSVVVGGRGAAVLADELAALGITVGTTLTDLPRALGDLTSPARAGGG